MVVRRIKRKCGEKTCRKSEETDVTGFTVSATANVDFETTGICQPKETGNMTVYPNPVKDELKIESGELKIQYSPKPLHNAQIRRVVFLYIPQ